MEALVISLVGAAVEAGMGIYRAVATPSASLKQALAKQAVKLKNFVEKEAPEEYAAEDAAARAEIDAIGSEPTDPDATPVPK